MMKNILENDLMDPNAFLEYIDVKPNEMIILNPEKMGRLAFYIMIPGMKMGLITTMFRPLGISRR